MTNVGVIPRRVERSALVAILLLHVLASVVGLTWGLPSRKIDRFLFGDEPPWSGEKIYRLAGARGKFSSNRGADVDADPMDRIGDEPILLTGTEENVARIFLRYRLYTHQPDEMITMMALAGMNPRKLQFDPRLYQYGGLFVYPVGALIAASGLVGLIDVRGDVVHYLDNPDEFGKFYVVARAYAAAWGLLGVVVVFAMARRLGGAPAGLLAALLFTLMPVVVCMAHEGKPHLPGAVLMLMAVLFAMRYLVSGAAGVRPLEWTEPGEVSTRGHDPRGLEPATQVRRAQDWWLMCVCCGAALGMVLSSWPIFVLLPLVAHRAATSWTQAVRRTLAGIGVATCVYLITNPYIAINAVVNRQVLASNFGNSLAMYQVARVGEGFIRVVALTIEGATLPVLVLGVLALVGAVVRRNGSAVPLVVAGLVFFLQFVLIGAGKPAEYGRFGVFTNTALVIGAACILSRRRPKLLGVVNWVPATIVVIWTLYFGAAYLGNFRADAGTRNTRIELASELAKDTRDVVVAVPSEPAPYCCPPLAFARSKVVLCRHRAWVAGPTEQGCVWIEPLERQETGYPRFRKAFRRLRIAASDSSWSRADTPISWANKPFKRTRCRGSTPTD